MGIGIDGSKTSIKAISEGSSNSNPGPYLSGSRSISRHRGHRGSISIKGRGFKGKGGRPSWVINLISNRKGCRAR